MRKRIGLALFWVKPRVVLEYLINALAHWECPRVEPVTVKIKFLL